MATLLLADVEGSTRLWESQSKEMAEAVARLDKGLAWLDAALGADTRKDSDKDPARVRVLADKGLLRHKRQADTAEPVITTPNVSACRIALAPTSCTRINDSRL